MTANELRIGNWVEGFAFDRKVYCKILSIHNTQDKGGKSDFLFVDKNENIRTGYAINYINDFKPIPLTPEILEKAGFKIGRDSDSISAYNPRLKLELEDSGWDVLRIAGECVFLNYFHELQNLYFALTGEELNIQL